MARFFDPNVHWWLSLAGWSVLVALWHTTIAALLLAIWRAGRWRATSSREYGVTAGVLALATVLTAATPLLLPVWPRHVPVPVSAAGGLLPVAGVFLPPRLMPDVVSQPMRLGVDPGLIAWAGLAWLAGACVGVLRLGGGWVLARRIRRAARPVSEPAILACAEAVCRPQGISPAILASDHVDAPVVIGHRHPAILLPRGAERELPPDAIEALLAHEVAHIVRRDYAVNLLQSLADALLFFSPGARWISRCVRDAREFCCDDDVAARWGAEPYVRSLATLASFGVTAHARPALNVAGPRLIVRVRRLLEVDVVPPFARVRVVAAIAVLVAAVVAGFAVVPLAASQVANSPTAQAPTSGRISLAFVTRQPGSSVTLRSVVESPEGLCGTAVVHNDADRAITQLQFIGILTALGGRPSSLLGLSDPLDVRVEPGKEATISPNIMPAAEARLRMSESRVQVTCGLVYVRFDNGFRWYVTPNAAATTADDILGLPRAEIPRALIGTPGANPNLCFDEVGRESSQGAVIAIRNEPGRFARCVSGAWVDYVLPGPTPAGPPR